MAKRKRIDPKLVKKLKERSNGMCEICGYRQATEIHHCFGGNGRRKQTERLELLRDSCYECHRGIKGIHNNRGLDLVVKRECQNELLNQGYKIDQVREMTGGKIYLE